MSEMSETETNDAPEIELPPEAAEKVNRFFDSLGEVIEFFAHNNPAGDYVSDIVNDLREAQSGKPKEPPRE